MSIHRLVRTKPILILAHPGHELRLTAWMARERPRVFVLSDGSGGRARSRIDYSRALVAESGGEAGAVFGLMPDRDWYVTMLAGDAAPFLHVRDAVLAALRAEPADCLVSDSVDGYNPLHDLTEALGRAVVAACRAEGRAMRHLTSPATAGAIGRPAGHWTLDGAAVARKRAAVAAYAPLAEEAARILAEEPGALDNERLLAPDFDWLGAWAPEWERLGRERVAAGLYDTAITYAGHVRPLAMALLDLAGTTATAGRRDAVAS